MAKTAPGAAGGVETLIACELAGVMSPAAANASAGTARVAGFMKLFLIVFSYM